ncbi:MAG: FAD-binding protein [Vicinamibacterales bacterium]
MTLAPRSLDELQEAVRASAPAPLRVRGGGSKRVAARDGTTLDTRALTGIVAYQAAECVITALAGTPLRDLHRVLAEHGQYLPFDPPLARRGATVGGTVAVGLSGSGRLRYGGIRDFVIGAAVVDGEGRLIRSGGQVVKNAAGFLLHHGLVGSAGRFGVIGEVALKVFPAPEARATLRVAATSTAAALAAHRRLLGAVPDLEALDVDVAEAVVWARLAGAASALPTRFERARAVVGDATASYLGGDDDAAVWDAAADLAWAPPGATVVKVAAAPSRLEALVAALGGLGPLRITCAGAAILVATARPVADVEAALPPGSRAAVARGADCGRVLGAAVSNVFGERVRRTLDPTGRFV